MNLSKLKVLSLAFAFALSFIPLSGAFANCNQNYSTNNLRYRSSNQIGSTYFFIPQVSNRSRRCLDDNSRQIYSQFPNDRRFRQPRRHVGFCPGFSRVPVQPNYRSKATNYIHDLNNEGLAVWPSHKSRLNVFINSGRGVYGYDPAYLNVLVDAFHEWSRASMGSIKFQPVSNASNADIIVSWTQRLNSDRNTNEVGKTLTVTSKHPRSSVGSIEKAHIYLLTQKNGRNFSPTEIKKVALHEIGHAIGLQGHSSNPKDIMHHTTSPYQSLSLTPRDINTLHSLYRTRYTASR